MKFARSLVAAATILALFALPALAESVSEEWDAGDLGGWQAIAFEEIVEVLPSGGVSDSGYLHTYQTPQGFGISGAVQRFEPYIGDFGARGYIVVRCDLKFFSGTFDGAEFQVRYLDGSHNGWYLPLTDDFSVGAWRNATFEFDPDWSDGEAMAAGWVQESSTPSFQETMANVYTISVRFRGEGDLEAGIDNFQLDDDFVGVDAVSWSGVKGLFR